MRALRKLLRQCGPGVISGAANDDPSCIVTFSMAGAQFGYMTLWTSLFTLPLIAALQFISAQLGMVSGRGLAGAARARWPAAVVIPVCFLLAVANTVTLGADIGGMADVTHMVTGISSRLWAVLYTAGLAGLLLFLNYGQIERVLKWLCLALFTYVAAAVLAQPDWGAALRGTLIPRFSWSASFSQTLVAILGATVSPYFLFWQTSQEVENEICLGRRSVSERRGATRREIEKSAVGVGMGSFVSKLITWCITLTCAAALFAHGKHDIATAQDAAAALQPAAGSAASWLFALGVVGTGLLAVPVLAGSCAYAWAEALRWRASLADPPRHAPYFYAVLFLAMLAGLGFLWMGFGVVQMLFWASVLNGLLAPVCILMLLLLARNQTVMQGQPAPAWTRRLGWIAFLVTAGAAVTLVAGFVGEGSTTLTAS